MMNINAVLTNTNQAAVKSRCERDTDYQRFKAEGLVQRSERKREIGPRAEEGKRTRAARKAAEEERYITTITSMSAQLGTVPAILFSRVGNAAYIIVNYYY